MNGVIQKSGPYATPAVSERYSLKTFVLTLNTSILHAPESGASWVLGEYAEPNQD